MFNVLEPFDVPLTDFTALRGESWPDNVVSGSDNVVSGDDNVIVSLEEAG